MGSFTLRTVLLIVAVAAAGLAFPATQAPAPTPAAAPCTTGSPVVTAGYTISYAPAVPTVAFQNGYQPEEAWSKSHVIATYVSTPVLYVTVICMKEKGEVVFKRT